MEIQIEPHTLARAEERWANLNEIEDTIENGTPIAAKQTRLVKSRVFIFEAERNGKFYKEKSLKHIM